MAFVPFTKDDQPTMAAFNEKFQQIFDLADSKTEVELLTYMGTGTYGLDNPNSLSFKRRPSFVAIYAYQYMGGEYAADEYPTIIHSGHNAVSSATFTEQYTTGSGFFGEVDSNMDVFGGKISADGKTMYWYYDAFSDHIDSSAMQFNRSGTKYYVLVLY